MNLSSKHNSCSVSISEIPLIDDLVIDTIELNVIIKGNIREVFSKLLNQDIKENMYCIDCNLPMIEIIAKKCNSNADIIKKLENEMYKRYNLKLEKKFVLIEKLKFRINDTLLLNKNGHVVYNENDDDIRKKLSSKEYVELYCGNFMGFAQPINYFYQLAGEVYNPSYGNLRYDTIKINNKVCIKSRYTKLVEFKEINNVVYPYKVEVEYDHVKGGYEPSGIRIPPLYTFGIPFEATGNFVVLKSNLFGRLGIEVESSIIKQEKIELIYSN